MDLKCCVVFALMCAVFSADAAKWTSFSEHQSVLSGISFISAQTGFMAGGDNGVGPEILRTDDGGTTFKQTKIANGTLMVMQVRATDTAHGVGTGIGILKTANQFTIDGQTFNSALDLSAITQCQSAQKINGVSGGYGLTGTFGSVNGVGITTNGGLSYKYFNWNGDTDPRYGSFPSSTTWYITGGTWPENQKDDHVHHLTRHIHISKTRGGFKFSQRGLGPAAGQNGTFQATIMKTVDGGKTFTKVFNDTGRFYFNAISCPDEDHCWAVAEGDGTPDGAWIWATSDGGKTWQQQHFGAQESLLAIHMSSTTEGWAGGGLLSSIISGKLYHTTDGGKTWVATTVAGVYVNDFSFLDADHGFATAFTQFGTCAFLKYA